MKPTVLQGGISSLDLDGFGLDHSMRSSASGRHASSSANTAGISWGSNSGSGDEPQSQDAERSSSFMTSATAAESAQGMAEAHSSIPSPSGVDLGLLVGALPQQSAPSGLSDGWASAAPLLQDFPQSAQAQQGMAAASAWLLEMGSHWGSNLGSL